MPRSGGLFSVLVGLVVAACAGSEDGDGATSSASSTSSTAASASTSATESSSTSATASSTSGDATAGSGGESETGATTGATTTGGPVECGGWNPRFDGAPADAAGADVELGDLTNDGALDLVVAEESGVRIAVNDGAGGFDAAVSLSWSGVMGTTAQTEGTDVSVGDLNGDGWDDIVVLARLGEVLVWLHPGSAELDFGDPIVLAKPAFVGPSGLLPHDHRTLLADIDGDGDRDLLAAVSVLADSGDGALAIYLNDGAGALTTPSAGVDIGSERGFMLAAGDLDGDGAIDVIATHVGYTGSGDVVSLRNQGLVMGAVTFAAPELLAADVRSPWVEVGDLDGDGDLDVVYSDYTTHTITVLDNAGDGSFAEKGSYPTEPEPSGMAIVDVDLDCLPDVVTTSYSSVEGYGDLHLNLGDGTFEGKKVKIGAPARNLRVADVTVDGYPELIKHLSWLELRVLPGTP